MKKLVLCLMVLLSINSFAQKTKSITVVNTGTQCKFAISGTIHYNGDTPTDTSYYIYAVDEQYTMIFSALIIKSGSPQELYDFMKELNITMGKEEVKTTVPFHGLSVYVTKFFGVKGVIISKDNWGSNAYCSIDYVKLSMLTDKLKAYCKKNNKPLVL